VTIDPVPGARTYLVRYGTSSLDQATAPTINPFVDIGGLATNTVYRLAAVARNDKGDSALSQTVNVTTGSAVLPPVIWTDEPLPGGFILGYAVEEVDRAFSLEVIDDASRRAAKRMEFTLKGSVRVEGLAPGRYRYRLRRHGDYGDSVWSAVREVTVPAN
jgi:hypothetical protein